MGITLLPFTEDQLYGFIRNWFKDNLEQANFLIENISKRNLHEHIKTPLLSTITCTLIEKGINAPSTESEIYKERFRLLAGEYDKHKEICRQKNTPQHLIECAQKIALEMHNRGIRSAEKTEIFEFMKKNLSHKFNDHMLNICLIELIDPCNILLLDPITRKYIFGHFRFQEFLVSEELKNRNTEITEKLSNVFWIGALCLYSQDNDISFVLDEAYNRFGNLEKYEKTLRSMIHSSRSEDKNFLIEVLEGHLKSDLLDGYIDETTEYNSLYSQY
ncbi:hypothetical protein GCM10011369_18690 [Neiella marina]|uniref:Uncharacterized protein n=1 Tax=Neiella marina TaxID=508461 RepID=A0A8J2XMB5_9GAMM|nr:hypothetical protein [Neiella marina]GGA77049.1 hypothetical protein GCM10011369_18690 [Neiella marina]